MEWIKKLEKGGLEIDGENISPKKEVERNGENKKSRKIRYRNMMERMKNREKLGIEKLFKKKENW